MTDMVHLGYAVGSGDAVSIPVAHSVVTGMTQLAGKTTTLEALIARARLPAVAFVTKRGERAFAQGRRIAPYMRERADWRFVQSVLEATMRERMKFERAWIMRASKGARSLADVQRNVRAALADKKVRGMSADVYLTLDAYLEIVVPKLRSVKFAERLELKPGLNVVDLSDRERFPAELQSLVIRSALEWVYEKCDGTVTIIPEAWEWLPQSRGSPVKLAAVELIRKGAGLRNYVWLDSQDIGGVDKELLRSCSVWLLGVQREANEIKRVLDNIPAGIAKPKPADVALLERGQFFACWGRHVVKTYVQPAWMDADSARAVAIGDCVLGRESMSKMVEASKALVDESEVDVEWVNRDLAERLVDPRSDEEIDSDFARADYARDFNSSIAKKIDDITLDVFMGSAEDEYMSKSAEEKLDEVLGLIRGLGPVNATKGEPVEVSPTAPWSPGKEEEEALYQRFVARLKKEAPALIRVLAVKPELHVVERIEAVEIDGKTLRGRVARLVADSFFDEAKTGNAAFNELQRVGFKTAKPNVYRECDALAEMGFLTKEPSGYRSVEDAKRSIKRKSA